VYRLKQWEADEIDYTLIEDGYILSEGEYLSTRAMERNAFASVLKGLFTEAQFEAQVLEARKELTQK